MRIGPLPSPKGLIITHVFGWTPGLPNLEI
jgi:hypothetical protein